MLPYDLTYKWHDLKANKLEHIKYIECKDKHCQCEYDAISFTVNTNFSFFLMSHSVVESGVELFRMV